MGEKRRCQLLQQTSSYVGSQTRSYKGSTTWTLDNTGADWDKHNYRLRLRATVRLHLLFYVNNLRPCSTASLRPAAPVTVPQGYDEDFDVSHISIFCVHQVVTWTTMKFEI
jgi:hypothetical protein